mmetsp:Transcript_19197/g.28954  ORF Transcript_19197/g.28954 Transcript_19197/m.28954 type:complete len:82 (+) Transcript_19197:1009-1254(+)
MYTGENVIGDDITSGATFPDPCVGFLSVGLNVDVFVGFAVGPGVMGDIIGSSVGDGVTGDVVGPELGIVVTEGAFEGSGVD